MRTLNISNTNNNNNTSSFEPPRHSTPSLADRSTTRAPSIPPSHLKSAKKLRPPPLKPTTTTITATTTTATNTPATSRTPLSSSRPRYSPASSGPASATGSDSRSSLGCRDQNHHVLSLRASRSTITPSASPKMPPGDSRSRPPQLSAAAAKSVNRTPLTPKIASKGPASATPLARRSTYDRNATGSGNDATTPNAPFLAVSATPRSGNRQHHADSGNTTPNGTPNLDRYGEERNQRSGLGISPGGLKSGRLSQGESPGDGPESKFFYASDARSLQPLTQPQRPLSIPGKSSTFFYASETSIEAKRTTSPPGSAPFTPILTSTPEPTNTKFFYANGVPDVPTKPTHQSSSGPSSAGSGASRNIGGRPNSGSSTVGGHAYSSHQRPMSPNKSTSQPNPPALKSSALPPGPLNRPPISSPPSLAASATAKSQRRVSIEAPPRIKRSHARTGSVPSIESLSAPRIPGSPAATPSAPISPPLSPGGLAQPAITIASILQAAEDMAGEEDEDGEEEGDEDNDEHDSDSDSQSPSKSKEPVNELVANARRERKVQDLQIRNASLEAINRTLERQLRKQTNELRRFRRLSRAGRLSIASPGSTHIPPETLSEPPAEFPGLSEDERESVAAEEEKKEIEHDLLEDSELSSAEEDSNADSLSSSDPKEVDRQKRDERRLQLDLTKHRELLVDSQKINQSIKRCLNWTEILIKEGQKALEYKVTISDVKFGGHVLAPPDDDFDDDEEVSQLGDDTLRLIETGLEPPWEKSPQDRDSGIELPAEGLRAVSA